MYYVYRLYFPCDKVYIGITTDPAQRQKGSGSKYYTNEEMFKDIRKYGWSNIRKDILDIVDTREEALAIERAEIEFHQADNPNWGYNKIL